MTDSSVEFNALVYGSLVSSMLEMTENMSEVNTKLDEIGYKIGLRIAHDFAKDITTEKIDTPDKVVNTIILKKWSVISGSKKPAESKQVDDKNWVFSFPQSIFTKNVTIPEIYNGVQFCSALPGALRGIFEVFQFKVNTTLVVDTPKVTEVKVEIVSSIPEAIPNDDD